MQFHINSKICPKCKLNKSLELFRNRTSSSTGKCSQCLECVRKENREYKRRKKEKIKEQKRRYCLKYPEKNRARSQRATKKLKEKDPIAFRANLSHHSMIRRARFNFAIPKWANLIRIKSIYRAARPGFEVDHIIPILNKLVCGLHVENNLRIITRSENRTKNNKLLPEFSEF